MTPNHDDRSPLFFPDGYYWDPTLDDPCAPVTEWFALDGCDHLELDDCTSIIHVRLRGIDYHIGDRTDVDGNGAEVVASVVMGSPIDVAVLEEMVTRHLPEPLPDGLGIEIDSLGDNDNVCWLVRRLGIDELEAHAVLDRLLTEFVSIAEKFVEGWAAA